jgi:hypothetical protein
MARRRIINRKEYRGDYEGNEEEKREGEEGEAEEEDEDEDEDEDEAEDEEGGEEEEDAPKAKKAKKPAKEPKPKKPRAGKAPPRQRAVWGVFSNSNQRVATFPFPEKEKAVAHAQKLREDKNQTYFVQLVKEPLVEEKK